tara:strand:- start:10788 stop:11987 length:1200 start_codon:yes stop_codon:yes gene_type:complete
MNKLQNKCEVCNSANMEEVLNLGLHPLCDDLINIEKKSTSKLYPIEILLCRECLTSHQKYQVDKHELFPKTYHYRSRLTNDVLLGMDNLVGSVETYKGSLNSLNVLDIGCNDGSLLDKFYNKGAKTIGIEPTGAHEDADKRHIIINDYFNELVAESVIKQFGKIDVITFTNVFAHIEDLPSLLTSLEILMNDETVIVIENHYLGAILEKNQFDTFYHEHPRTYSLKSFVNISKSINCNILDLDFPKRYGGNIRVMLGRANPNGDVQNLIDETLKTEESFYDKFIEMNKFIEIWKLDKKKQIKKLVEKHGRLKAKAFPGRAAILIKLLNLSNNEIEAVYEKPGSPKINNFVPGTRIPIRPDSDLNLKDLEIILNFAWHISKEIRDYLSSDGFNGEVIDIL